VLDAVHAMKPSLILHAAAFTAVDACEDDSDLAFRVNALGTRNVCEAAEQVGARVVYFSTDHVFDGKKTGAYDEFDTPTPVSVYGRSKHWGELFVLRSGPAHVVVRTSRLFGGTGRSYPITCLAEAKKLPAGEPYLAVSDQVAVPTFIPDLATRVCDIAERGGGGIYHVTSSGPPCSWDELARRAFAAAGVDREVRGIAGDERPLPAYRSKNGVLANRVLALEGIEPLPSWQDALERHVTAHVKAKGVGKS
jgi:dTDP-4-dehydrorhamnose reductase